MLGPELRVAAMEREGGHGICPVYGYLRVFASPQPGASSSCLSLSTLINAVVPTSFLIRKQNKKRNLNLYWRSTYFHSASLKSHISPCNISVNQSFIISQI